MVEYLCIDSTSVFTCLLSQSEVNQSLVLAAKEGLVDLVRELLAKPGINVDYNEYKVELLL